MAVLLDLQQTPSDGVRRSERHGATDADERPPVRHVFVVGCPRSGTTWLQLLLARHPDVVTSQETHLFSAYLGHLMRTWERDTRLPGDRRRVGLTSVLEEDLFLAACRCFADALFEPILADKPGARVLVEKTPGHVLLAEEILRLYPEAAFIHVIRDPRDVVCSLRSAGRSWGRHWAPTNVAIGAAHWRRLVEAGRAISSLTSRYKEVRYGDLARDAASQLEAVCAFVGLEADRAFCVVAAEACRLDRLKSATTDPGTGSARDGEVDDDAGDLREEGGEAAPWRLGQEPPGFFRRGRARGWMGELTPSELRRVEHAASPLMTELGYQPVSRRAARRPLRTALREGLRWRLERTYEAVLRRLERL